MRALKWSTRALHVLEGLVLTPDFSSYDTMTGSEIMQVHKARLRRVRDIPLARMRKRVLKGLRKRFPKWDRTDRGNQLEYRQLLAVGKCGHGTARAICKTLGFDVPRTRRHQCVCRVCGRRGFVKERA